MKTEKMRLTYLPLAALLLLLLTVLGRGMGYIYSTMATDIAYSDLAVEIMGILVEVLTILRTVTGYCVILYAMYRWEKPDSRYRCGGAVTLLVLVCDAADCFSRYLVDKATSSITDMETVAAIWLLLQFCYSTILVMLCWCTGYFLFHPASGKTPASLEKVSFLSVMYLLGTRLVLEIYYLIDFLTAYSNVTGNEVSAIIGQFLHTLVLYGGAALGLILGIGALLRQMYGECAEQTGASPALPAENTAENG